MTMLWAQLRRIAPPRLPPRPPRPNRIFGAGSSRRAYGTEPNIPKEFLPPVPVLRPTLWALTATATIFLGCAAYDVHRDVRDLKRRGLLKNVREASYEDVEIAKHRGGHSSRRSSSRSSPSSPSKYYPPGQLGEVLAAYNDAEKVLLGFSALNISLLGAHYMALIQHFGHVPCFSPNYTLLTSMFGHTGLLHAGLNTFVLLQFAPQVAGEPRVFAGNGCHFAAFYLSAGILSSLGSQISSILPSRNYQYRRLVPHMGASGVISAFLAMWAALYPEASIGILFVPGSYSAQNFLLALVAFETCGLFFGIPLVKFAHGQHLAGLAIGWAYARYDGKKHVWRPSRKAAFAVMKRLHLV
ncbi:rhomboid-domain-containing protein [Daldinia caldariorum]|uniref:rhomboid-domain-containing protein n=1 Tax=Daldinia caldariorum TaxID=326644 RepID=UPI002008769F|nr:rhomboid-domain-containing protein [Daldinia caldariorum]KAI1465950.1 rhomboid-domain-containing protein [Daldinia caldariorum]